MFKKLTPVLSLAFLLWSCDDFPKTTKSEILTEEAVVVQKSYVPATAATSSGGFGMTSSGRLIVTFGETIRTAEIWAVVVKCKDHEATFALKDRKLYQSTEVGDTLILEYFEQRYYAKGDRQIQTGKEPTRVDYHTTSARKKTATEK